MKKICINENQDGFLLEGKPFFYFADTVWSVFSNSTLEEWEEYLDYRSLQNFNALQISVLPILHDASSTYTGLFPFQLLPDGKWDFYKVNPDFFDQAEKMLMLACDKGFVPVLVILWSNYVPGTWANLRVPDFTMPVDAVKSYTEYVAERFKVYHPIYFISGDTKFENEESIEYYQISLKALKAVDPQSLAAMHVFSEFHELPQAFIDSDELDLYVYQAGHVLQNQSDNYLLAQQFLEKRVKRPIINSEPPYESHGHGNLYGRFDAFAIRKAFWFSVLGGAKAGFTYGAHGVWSWHKKGARFTSEKWSKVPFEWRNSLKLKGAWDAAFSKWLFETYRLFDIQPAAGCLLTDYEDIRMAASPDLSVVVVYAPYCNDVVMKWDGAPYDFDMIDLETRNVIQPKVEFADGSLIVRMSEYNSDVLIIGRKRNRSA